MDELPFSHREEGGESSRRLLVLVESTVLFHDTHLMTGNIEIVTEPIDPRDSPNEGGIERLGFRRKGLMGFTECDQRELVGYIGGDITDVQVGENDDRQALVDVVNELGGEADVVPPRSVQDGTAETLAGEPSIAERPGLVVGRALETALTLPRARTHRYRSSTVE